MFRHIGIFCYVLILFSSTSLARSQCRQIFTGQGGLDLLWAPYVSSKIDVPEVLKDPYVEFAIKSDEFRLYLLNGGKKTQLILDYKTLVDATPKYSPRQGPKKPRDHQYKIIKAKDLSFDQLYEYLVKNYDLKNLGGTLPAKLRDRDGPKQHPLLKELRKLPSLSALTDKQWEALSVVEAIKEVHRMWSDLLFATPTKSRTTELVMSKSYRLIKSGGRFRESYFWDSLWINKGLLASGYKKLARESFEYWVEMIERFGIAANGGRFYYLTRTQLPVLVEMAKDLEQAGVLRFTENTSASSLEARFLKAADQYYFSIWKGSQRYDSQTGLFRYSDAAGGELNPKSLVIRPEAGIREPRSKERHSQRVFAESGWDMSYSRFGQFPQHWLPVDLNATLAAYTRDLSVYFNKTGQTQRARVYRQQSNSILKNMRKYLFSESKGLYLDYNLKGQKLSTVITAASFFPYYFALEKNSAANRQTLTNLMALLKPNDSLALHTTSKEGEGQWDGHWSWANLNEVAFRALKKYGLNKQATDLAMDYSFLVIDKFLGYDKTFFEKYSARGGSLEVPKDSEIYGNEVGFGWTNSVLILFLKDLTQQGFIPELEQRFQ